MQHIKVGAAVLNQTPLDWEGNKTNVLTAIDEARGQGVSLLCLPEMCLTGYGCEDAYHSASVKDTAWDVLQEILPATRGIVVAVGLPVLHRNALFNTACLVANGKVLGFVGKRFLAGDGIHYEQRWFKPWPEGVQAQVTVDGNQYPIGDLYFDCGGVRIGFEICEDAWVATRPGGNMSRKGIDVIFNPSASHFAFDKSAIRERFIVEGSRAFGVTYVYANLLGNEAGRAIYDGGAMIASGGKLLARGPRFSFANCCLTTAIVDIEATRMSQARTTSFRPELTVDEKQWVKTQFLYPRETPAVNTPSRELWETSSYIKDEEFTRALALALYDYLRKSRSEGFVVSLSGGADSSAVACLVCLMVQIGVEELGLEAFVEKLGPADHYADLSDENSLIHRLLTCVYQATENSSEKTRYAAQSLAESMGATFIDLDVNSLFKDYVELIGQATGSMLNWDDHDIALQNIQARVRAPSVWLLANLKNAILLATSNRSEAAVGYATMDGDTCGGLSPIAGIDKAFLRGWLSWLEETGPEGIDCFTALAPITCQEPSAELRPPHSGQTDEDDLMPYDVLDAIERAAIRDKHAPLNVFLLLRERFSEYAAEQLAFWVERFFKLWCRNQWKRERYAPSFHLDDENLDPKTWCRFPILSGGFARELEEMRDYLAARATQEMARTR